MTKSSDDALAAAGYPRRPYSQPERGRLRQGDLFWAYATQLRTKDDLPGPGPDNIDSDQIAPYGKFLDVGIDAFEKQFQLRVWACWVMVLTQGCDLDHPDPQDSRLLVAPIVFSAKWQGKHWSRILAGDVPGFLYLPSMSVDEKNRAGAGGWPEDEEAAVVLSSACVISREIARRPVFGLSPEMRALLQERMVVFWSVRNWTTPSQFEKLKGKRIVEIHDTEEKALGPGRLYKLTLANGEEDEATVGLVLRRD